MKLKVKECLIFSQDSLKRGITINTNSRLEAKYLMTGYLISSSWKASIQTNKQKYGLVDFIFFPVTVLKMILTDKRKKASDVKSDTNKSYQLKSKKWKSQIFPILANDIGGHDIPIFSPSVTLYMSRKMKIIAPILLLDLLSIAM